MQPTHIIIHHTKTIDSGTVSWGVIRKYHKAFAFEGEIISRECAGLLMGRGKTVKQPYQDIGYHVGIELINDHVEVLMGRQFNKTGAHCKQQGMNFKSIGVAVTGDFDHVRPSAEIWKEATKVTRMFMELFNIPVANIHGHREFADYKSCPGLFFDMGKFRAELF